MSDSDIATHLTRNAEAISELQGVIVASVKDSKKDYTIDKMAKWAQLAIPLTIVWLVYFVNAELTPVKMDIRANSTLVGEYRDEINKLRNRLHAYDVKEARRDAVMEQMQQGIADIKALINNLKKQ